MVHWLKSAHFSLVRSNKIFSFALVPACSRRPSVLNLVAKRDQQTRNTGAQTKAKLFVSRGFVISAVVLAGGAIAAWHLRKQQVALHAESRQAQGHTGSGPLAFRGTAFCRVQRARRLP